MEKITPPQTIIIRRYKRGSVEEHGGSWKIAMADFALALMAIFLVLWIINSSDEEQRKAIAGYFKDPEAVGESSTNPSRYVIDMGGSPTVSNNIAESETVDPEKMLSADEIESLAEAIEKRRLEDMRSRVEEQISASPRLSPFKNHMMLDITTEGLRLQIVDKIKRPMFEPNSSVLTYFAEDILWELAPILGSLDRRLSITGHTDTTALSGQREEDDRNWVLSSMRADAARRALMEAGIPKSQIAQVIGMGDTQPLDKDNPGAVENHRISVTLLTRREEVSEQEQAQPTPLKVAPEDVRAPTIEKSDDALFELKTDRDRPDNSYDYPPNREEVFWEDG
ncbi:MAG: OmpA family protein [Oleibacter sp.]|nr:OmpA family protein [Thalassolituus sp.]